MIELSTQMPQAASPVSAPAAPGGAAGGFVQVLAQYLDAGVDTAPGMSAAPILPADRQGIADDGKILPAIADEKHDVIDPALIWLPMALPIPAPIAQSIPPPPDLHTPPALSATAVAADPAMGSVVRPALAPGDVLSPDRLAAIKTLINEVSGKAALPMPAADTPCRSETGPTESPLKAAAVAAPSPTITAPAAQPAGQAFAVAIAAAVANRDRFGRDQDHADARGSATPILTAQAEAVARPIVQAAADAKHAALDLRDDRGLHGMIDRIEMLRDDANARDTRIRLVPDALGGVDIALRKDGDTLHVRFTAETQATRTLLAEAQPRLAELADARGVKLGQTSVDTGGGGGSNRQARPETPRMPAHAHVPIEDADLSTDQRLA